MKTELRRELRQIRAGIPDRAARDAAIFANLLTLPQFAAATSVLTYVSVGSEVGTSRILDYCLARGIPVAVPAIVDEEMRFFRIEQNRGGLTLSGNQEPLAVAGQVCITPGLAFSPDNYRLGYGGGYYDKFFQDYSGYKIGLCYKELIRNIPTLPHDMKVDAVVAG